MKYQVVLHRTIFKLLIEPNQFACHAATENLEMVKLMAGFKNWTETKLMELQKDAISTKAMLTVAGAFCTIL